MTEANHHILMR